MCFLFIYVWIFRFIAHTFNLLSHETHNTLHGSKQSSWNHSVWLCAFFVSSFIAGCLLLLFFISFCSLLCVSSADASQTHFSHIVHRLFVREKLMFVLRFCFYFFMTDSVQYVVRCVINFWPTNKSAPWIVVCEHSTCRTCAKVCSTRCVQIKLKRRRRRQHVFEHVFRHFDWLLR